MPPQTVQRYQVERVTAPSWSGVSIVGGRPLLARILRIEVFDPAMIHWSSDQWQTTHDLDTQDTGLGVYSVDLPTADLAPGSTVLFTFFWRQAHRWEGADFKIEVVNEAGK